MSEKRTPGMPPLTKTPDEIHEGLQKMFEAAASQELVDAPVDTQETTQQFRQKMDSLRSLVFDKPNEQGFLEIVKIVCSVSKDHPNASIFSDFAVKNLEEQGWSDAIRKWITPNSHDKNRFGLMWKDVFSPSGAFTHAAPLFTSLKIGDVNVDGAFFSALLDNVHFISITGPVSPSFLKDFEETTISLPNVRSLMFEQHTTFPPEGLRSIFEAKNLFPNLQHLTISGQSELAGQWATQLPKDSFPKLHSLKLSRNQLSTQDLQALVSQPWFLHVKELELSHNRMEHEALRILLLAASELRELRLVYCDLNDKDADAISHTPTLRSIEKLDLWGNNFSLDAEEKLSKSPYLPKLVVASTLRELAVG